MWVKIFTPQFLFLLRYFGDGEKIPCLVGVRNEQDLPIRSKCLSHLVCSWISGPWQSCSTSCGGGVMTRYVYCMKRLNNGSFVELSSGECTGRKLITEKPCNVHPCPTWHAGQWSPVSKRTSLWTDAKRQEKYEPITCMMIPYQTEQEILLHLAQWKTKSCFFFFFFFFFFDILRKETSWLTRISGCIFSISSNLITFQEKTLNKMSILQCSVTCEVGVQRRAVICRSTEHYDCSPKDKPPARRRCRTNRPCAGENGKFTGTHPLFSLE